MNRGNYAGVFIAITIAKNLLAIGFVDATRGDTIIGVLWVASVAAYVYISALRCKDIEIHEAWGWAVIIPLAPLYFMFKRGKEYRVAKAKKDDPLS